MKALDDLEEVDSSKIKANQRSKIIKWRSATGSHRGRGSGTGWWVTIEETEGLTPTPSI